MTPIALRPFAKRRWRPWPGIALLAGVLCLWGCQTPTGLIQEDLEAARAAYERSRSDPAVVRNASAALENARQALAEADQAWAERHDPEETRHLATLALRRSALARAMGLQGAAEERQQQRETEQRTGKAQPSQSVRDQAALQQALQPLPDWAAAQTPEREVVVTLQDVLFRSSRAVLRPNSWRTVARVVQVLQAFPAQRVVITGHADSTGEAARNQALSLQRAEAFKAAVVAHGIAPERVLTRAQGERLPVADNTSVEGRALNRRVEVVFPDATGPAAGTRSRPSDKTHLGVR